MSQRLVVDPVTRIEGHLRIEALLEGSVIREAYSSGTMVRGIEIILRGRDPRDAWAFTQRICGVCTVVHAMASVRAVEQALSYPIPPNAQIIRNLMIAAQFVHDHVMHFYHLHALDWVDLLSALKADPEATAALARKVSPRSDSSAGRFREVQTRLTGFAEGGQLGIFGHGYWGHPGYKLPPEANLMAVAHYLEALSWQREVVAIHTLFGGKNPHPNFTVGGVPCALAMAGGEVAGAALDILALQRVGEVIDAMERFVHQVYLPDLLAIAGFYPEWSRVGEGVGNFMTFGEFPEDERADPARFLVPRGVILDRDLGRIHPVDLEDPEQVEEGVSRSWYEEDAIPRHPYQGETKPRYAGPTAPGEGLALDRKYSWLKSPRWRGRAVEVGPLARALMLYAQGHQGMRTLVDRTLHDLDLPLTALYSTLGRTAARGLETALLVGEMRGWFTRLQDRIRAGDLTTFNPERWDPATWPARARGVGAMEAPRGALGHWVVIEDGRIANYQAVVPSTWNAGPRDGQGIPGPYEAALAGQEVHDPDQPLEILRTLHSFDPCIACAVHLLDAKGGEIGRARVR